MDVICTAGIHAGPGLIGPQHQHAVRFTLLQVQTGMVMLLPSASSTFS